MKSKSKFQIAMAAGMSSRTFARWLAGHRTQLQQMGLAPRQQLLPPRAVQYICDELGIHEADFG